MEEGGIKVTLKGVLRIEHSEANKYGSRMRVIFYAEPKDEHQKEKTVADGESLESRWLTIAQMDEFSA